MARRIGIELRCIHNHPRARNPRVRYVCPSHAVLWVAGAVGRISFIVLAAFGRWPERRSE